MRAEGKALRGQLRGMAPLLTLVVVVALMIVSPLAAAILGGIAVVGYNYFELAVDVGAWLDTSSESPGPPPPAHPADEAGLDGRRVRGCGDPPECVAREDPARQVGWRPAGRPR